MDYDYWGVLALLVVILIMMTPSTIDKTKRKFQSRKTTRPDAFFDRMTEYTNDIA